MDSTNLNMSILEHRTIIFKILSNLVSTKEKGLK